jgi:hypothetical protein
MRSAYASKCVTLIRTFTLFRSKCGTIGRARTRARNRRRGRVVMGDRCAGPGEGGLVRNHPARIDLKAMPEIPNHPWQKAGARRIQPSSRAPRGHQARWRPQLARAAPYQLRMNVRRSCFCSAPTRLRTRARNCRVNQGGCRRQRLFVHKAVEGAAESPAATACFADNSRAMRG